MKKIRYALWALVVGVVAVVGWKTLSLNPKQNQLQFSRDFELTTGTGERISGNDLIGRPHLVFFGFTNCPEICPTTLYEVTAWMEQLGDDAKKLDAYFITVDPEQDTPKLLAEYMTAFDGKIKGLSGSVEDIDKVAKAFHVYYKKVALDDGGYTMDHTASVYLMKADGDFMSTIAWQEASETALAKLKRLLKS